MEGLNQVSLVIAAALAIVYFVVLLAPKIRDLFPRKDKPVEKMVEKRTSDRPDACAPCRQEVHEVKLALVEHRRETLDCNERLVQSTDNLRDTMGDLRDIIRDMCAEQRALRQTGQEIRVPPVFPVSGRGR